MNGRSGNVAGKVALVLLFGAFAQTTFGADLRVDNVAPDFMMLLAVCAGIAGGPQAGALAGFGAGLLSDMFLQNTPFGLSALAACLAGFAVGWARANLFQPSPLLTPLIAAAGTGMGVAIFVVAGYLVGQAQLVAPGKSWLVEQAVVEGVFSAVLALPATALMGWALRGASGVLASSAEPPADALGPPRPSRASARSRRRRRSQARARTLR
ncbi:MAG: rod shape-determining protein MreD [Acidimicrobiales bacterium]